MKNKLKILNKQLDKKLFDQFSIESISKNSKVLTISFESISGGEYENETLIVELEGVDYFSIPWSFSYFSKVLFLDMTNDFFETLEKLNIVPEDLCDIDDQGQIFKKLIKINFSESSSFYIMFSNLNAWLKIYPNNTRINIC